MATLQAPPPTMRELQEASWAAIENVCRRARIVEKRWGYGVLPQVVPIEWMERFRAQKQKFELACFEFDHPGIRKHGEAMLRAYDKLEEVAEATGQYPEPLQHWEFTLNTGELVILVRDRAEMARIDPKGRAAQIWSLEEVADVIAKFPDIARAKDSFPGAEFLPLSPSKRSKDLLNDSLEDLPF